ncbi:ER degradation-enhancing alpha-mannosidase-like protein 1 [Aspergillus lentulus]|uniref:alpha-1,2-Mannosidase n=2 Tax=Aspergillus lentulus TaxID=293939 RepID=A0AAN4PFA9_ASPLE|nr:ER degradation-enhancing alpha-mannosidase-like protein 1 [Aspergillus lentulus]
MEPPRVSTTQQTKSSHSSLNSTFGQNGSNPTVSHLQNEIQGLEYGAGRHEPHAPGESTAAGDSGLNATVSPDTPPVPHIPVNLPRPADSSDSNGEWPSDARSTRETQFEGSRREADRSSQQKRSCMPTLRDRSIRRRLYTLIPATVFLLAIIAFYLAIHTATHLGQEIHILLIFMILILSIIFCHTLIRFAMEILQDPRSTVARNRIPSRVGPMGYAQPDRPIQVTLAGDEEALVDDAVREKVTTPPPAYGLWRSSVRINPDLLYWRRVEDDELPPAAVNGTQRRSNRKPSVPRPPSYTSDDGVDYVIQAQPRRFAARHDTEDPVHQKETEHMFYHGFENYMKYAFPEDELRPLSCRPLVRDRDNPSNAELNDVLGNYSLTLIDSLSSLAILSSSPDEGERAWNHFQDGVRDFVKLYGDGSDGPAGQGERARGFDLDSKVQVFETVIRGLGGLLSAHLFAVGDLPITRYTPPEPEASFAKAWNKSAFPKNGHGIKWTNGFVYDGQLLRLAADLANRLLPAFYTDTGLPYPRVNLRHGVQRRPFYANSPLNADKPCHGSDREVCREDRQRAPSETTETCSAGAGSLVLEFTVLSRLTGDGRYEELAKRAFWAVWMRRSDIGLIGSGIDAESGRWVHSYTGIGAGIDSFFEYAFKSYVLLSSGQRSSHDPRSSWQALDGYFPPLSEYEHSAEAFLRVWEESHAAIKRHLYRGEGYQHPHVIQGDIFTGATRAFWIDSLSAFYPGLLSIAGELDEAIAIHLLTAAVWTRFSGLPERWNVATGNIEGELAWYGGRPEFIESTYYIYLATKDPWYLYVGEMVLRDLKRRCWAKCGWAGLQDVRNGELNDRMESFFLGETAKYLFLLYHPDHPLNNMDRPFVFSTEGHPLIIPTSTSARTHQHREQAQHEELVNLPVCQLAPEPPTFGLSSTAARPDVFHAATLARLHLMPNRGPTEGPILEYAHDHPSVTVSDLSSPTNYTFYPWTLPPELVPFNATSSPMTSRPTLDISFPAIPGMVMGPGSIERVRDGIFIKNIGGLRLSMVQDVPALDATGKASQDNFRVQVINNVPLGKDEKVYLSREITFDVLDPTDPNFTRMRDSAMIDIVIDVMPELLRRGNDSNGNRERGAAEHSENHIIQENVSVDDKIGSVDPSTSGVKNVFSSLMDTVSALLRDENPESTTQSPSRKSSIVRLILPAAVSSGAGSAPVPEVEDASIVSISGELSKSRLSWSTIYFADEICDHRILREIAQSHQILVIKRGGCSFSQKLRNIAAYPPSRHALKLVIVIDYGETAFAEASTSKPPASAGLAAIRAEPFLIRPLLDEPQMTAGGLPRRHPISMVMVGGGEETYELLRRATGVGIKRRYSVRSQGIPINNLYIV